jgi:hypothetical protein
MTNKEYWIMDGRARFDVDRAVVCEVCDSLKEAKRHAPNYGDACVVDAATMEVVWSGLTPTKKGGKRYDQERIDFTIGQI